MTTGPAPDPDLTEARLKVIDAYFRGTDSRDPAFLDLFTEDVELFFPKFGLTRGKAAVAQFGARLTAELESLEHDIPGLRTIVAGDTIVVEGTEAGVTRAGLRWPDGVVSQGRFCDVFDFAGTLIRSVHIYVDPDFTSADRDRIRILRGEAAAGGGTRAALERYIAAMRSDATPEAVASLFTEDADWDIPGAVDRVPWIGRRHGRAGAADFVRALWDGIEPIRFDVTAIAAEGDRAFAAGTLESRAKRTGRIMRSDFVIDATVRDGLISRFRLLEDSFAVAEAAG
ncbi:nuclear transport factor 2 family protein [Inquilinus sp. OTU3971]|uniref:nuclear transport factor 2 family protein n=1 Tax=Inquilinus sp. OTU3971 TaxID=3043855 RepID=UPI00313D5899